MDIMMRADIPQEKLKELEIMSGAEIAIAKRRQMLNALLEKGDPFTNRFICSFPQIACIAKEIVETESIPRYALGNGINGSKILKYGPREIGQDFSAIKPIRDKMNERMEKYRIGYGLWKFTYSFESYDEMVKEILHVLMDKPKEIENKEK